MNRQADFTGPRPFAYAALGTLVLAALLFAARGPMPLLEPEEARYAEIPRQMSSSGQFLIPVHDGQDYLDKPPLLYWMVSASFAIFGVHDWAARLPALLAAWLTVVVVLAWGWKTAGPGTGVAAALTLTLAGDFVYRAPMLTMNGPLGLFVSASLASGHLAMLDGRTRRDWWFASAMACGLGILMKGPLAAALIAPPLVVAPMFDKRLGRPSAAFWFGWSFVTFLVSAPWFVAAEIQRPGFLDYFLWRHHVERFATPFDHAAPIWHYIPQLAIAMAPWSFLAAAWWGWGRFRGDWSPEPHAGFLGLVAGLWGFVLFSVSGSKRPVYLTPIYPPLALAVGAELWQLRQNLSRAVWIAIFSLVALAIIGGELIWLPAYSRKFSIEAVVGRVEPVGPETPIVCYGQGWDSVGFYLQRNDVVTLIGERRAQLASVMAGHDRAIVFVTTKSAGDDFFRAMPDGKRFIPIAANRMVRAGWIVPLDD